MCKELSGLTMLLLLSCWIIAGIRAEGPTLHYGVKNSSLCLKVGKAPPYVDGQWRFNNEEMIVFQKNVTPKYMDKVVYNPEDLSLCINKLTVTDSGIYEVSIVHSGFKSSTEIHKLIVQETVPTPVIRMSLIHSNLSTWLCNITVNCSIQDDWVWSLCDEHSCRTSQKSLREVSITISVDNRSIVCSGNNNVSTRNVSERIEAMCFNKSDPEQERRSQTLIVILIFAACMIPCAIVIVVKMCLSRENNHQARTSPVQLIQNQPLEAQPQPQPQPQPATRPSTSSSSEAEASYENVGAVQPSQTSSPTISPREELGSKQSQKVDTIYSFLQVPNATASVGKSNSSKDAEGHEQIQEASNSQLVTLDESKQPVQVDTVYSVLQRPKNIKSQQHK